MNANRRFEKQKFAGFKPKPPKEKTWSHQSELESLKGQAIHVLTIDGSRQGVLVEADQFTIKLDRRSEVEPALVIFKSAIITFRKVQ